jgi:hypothetical protein
LLRIAEQKTLSASQVATVSFPHGKRLLEVKLPDGQLPGTTAWFSPPSLKMLDHFLPLFARVGGSKIMFRIAGHTVHNLLDTAACGLEKSRPEVQMKVPIRLI